MRALAAATALFLLSATAAPAIPSMTSAPAISATGAPGAAANAATGKNDAGAQLDEPLPNAVDFKQSSDAQTLLSKASVAIGRFRSQTAGSDSAFAEHFFACEMGAAGAGPLTSYSRRR